MSESSGSAVAVESVPDAKYLEAILPLLDLSDALRVLAGRFEPGRLAVVSNFGPSTLVVLHTLHEIGIRLPVVFIDTLHHFPETLEHVERVRERYDLDLRVYRPAPTRADFEAMYGPELWRRDLDRYHEVAKVEPFREATAELDGWITGRRRDQSGARDDLPLVETGQSFRFNLLAFWSRTEVWRFILTKGVPYNPLHDRGYASIGDAPLTTPVREGEPERAGRWRGLGRSECGIHQDV